MDVFEKIRILSGAGEFDSCGPKTCEVSYRVGDIVKHTSKYLCPLEPKNKKRS